jgi:hypothetical protein
MFHTTLKLSFLGLVYLFFYQNLNGRGVLGSAPLNSPLVYTANDTHMYTANDTHM